MHILLIYLVKNIGHARPRSMQLKKSEFEAIELVKPLLSFYKHHYYLFISTRG